MCLTHLTPTPFTASMMVLFPWRCSFGVTRGRNVLAARCRGIAVVDDHRHIVVAIEYRVADAAGQTVVPETAVAHDGHGALPAVGAERGRPGRPQAIAHDAVAHVEGRQRCERMAADVGADMQGPVSRCKSFMAVNSGRSGQPVHKPDGRDGTRAARRPAATSGLSVRPDRRQRLRGCRAYSCGTQREMNSPSPLRSTSTVYSPCIGSTSLPIRRADTSCLRKIWLAACSMNSGCPSSTTSTARLPAAEFDPLVGDQRIGDIQHVERNPARSERIRAVEQLQSPQHAVVQAALKNDPHVAPRRHR